MIEYFVFTKDDVKVFRDSLIYLMEIILADNIMQKYPEKLAEDYVNKMENFIGDGSAFVVGAKIQDKLAGFSWAYVLNIFDEFRFHIDMICVNPRYRKKGIARQLIKLQIEEAKKRDLHAIEAMATRKNENSYNWFHSLGFEDERIKVKLDI